MLNANNHSYHMVDMSPWPLIMGISALSLFSSIIELTVMYTPYFLFFNLTLILLNSLLWWRDVARESKFQGLHLKKVIVGLKMGMILFIVSEIFFFVSFFWAFFHFSLSPNMEIGSSWPHFSLNPFMYWEIPLLNTLILLISGVTMTWSHLSMVYWKLKEALISLGATISLGAYFALLQYLEYSESSYSFADSSFGCSFFIATGFHGMHIIVGTLFLIVTFVRMNVNSFSYAHHLGFEAAAWYWHFVDVVWLFLFTFIYWWSMI